MQITGRKEKIISEETKSEQAKSYVVYWKEELARDI